MAKSSAILSAMLLFLFTVPGLYAGDLRTLSVLYFSNTSGNAEYDWLTKGMSDMLVTDLWSAKQWKIVEREELEKILKEQQLQLSGLTDSRNAVQVGKILGADLLVYGSFLITGNILRLDVKAVSPESGTVSATATVSGAPETLLDLEKVLATRLSSGLGLGSETNPSGGPSSVDSARSYYRGLSLLDDGEPAKALELFTQAARKDPLFLKAGQGIEAAYTFLKDFRNQRYRWEMNSLAQDIEALVKRIQAPEFYGFADTLTNPGKYGFADGSAAAAAYQARPRVMAGESIVQAIWNLQLLYLELGGLAMDYFQDESLKTQCQDQILLWAGTSAKKFPRDPWLPEVLYQPLFVYQDRGAWKEVKDLCETLMGTYPDFRMMWAVEDAYERALENLGP